MPSCARAVAHSDVLALSLRDVDSPYAVTSFRSAEYSNALHLCQRHPGSRYLTSFVVDRFALSLQRQNGRRDPQAPAEPSDESRHKEEGMLESQLDLLQQHLIVEKGLARNTLAAYMSDLQYFCAFVRARGASTFQELTREDIIGYLAERRQQGIAARTTARELVSLKTLYRFLHLHEAGTADPTAQIQAPKQGRYLPNVLTP